MLGTTLFTLIFLPHFLPQGKSRRSEKAFELLDRINRYPLDRKRPLRIVVELICIVTFFTASWVTFDSNLKNIGYNEPDVIRSQQLYNNKINHDNASMYYAIAANDLDEALLHNVALTSALDSLAHNNTIRSYTKTTQLFIPTSVQEERIARWKEYWNEQRIADTRQKIEFNVSTEFEITEIEKNTLVDMIRNNFGADISEIMNIAKKQRMIHYLILIISIIFIVISSLLKVKLLSQITLILGWILLGESICNFLYKGMEINHKISRRKQIVNAKIVFK